MYELQWAGVGGALTDFFNDQGQLPAPARRMTGVGGAGAGAGAPAPAYAKCLFRFV